MNKKGCPDFLTIQSVVDNEEKDQTVMEHLSQCPDCREREKEIRSMVLFANQLTCKEKLPFDFYSRLSESSVYQPFPALPFALALFAILFASVYIIDPGYLNWWLTVGITSKIGLFMDTFFELLYFGINTEPVWIIIFLATLVLIEVIILSGIKRLEGVTK